MKQTKFLLSILCLFFASTLPGQTKIISGIVKDSHSEEPVPFASVLFKNTTTGKLTDSSGSFVFHLDKLPSDTLLITCVGYQPFLYIIDKTKDSLLADIQMERGTFDLGVVVRIKVNKGLLLWRKIVKHKSQNDRYRFQNFSYELYNKLELDIKNLNFNRLSKFKPLKPVGDLIRSNVDTSEGLKYLPTFLTEVLSDYYYQKKPEKFREVIKAANTNGVKNESAVKLLGGMDQNVNVYNNFIQVFDKQFVSPISDNGDYYYKYGVVDTQFFNHHKFYHMIFTPRRKGENTFEGDCWVNDTTFAIQKMNLRLGNDANVNFLDRLSLIQEYSLINDSTWFLSKDKFVADVSPLGKGKLGFIGRKTTTYKNVVINDSSVSRELAKNKIREEVITLPGADEKSKEFWSSSRHEELSNSEQAIIKMIDTLTNAPVFKRFTKTITFIGTGYLDVGNYQLGPWYNAFSYDGWEGYRVRFDFGTNHHFDKHFWWHGYMAYGFGDQKWKGKAELFYLPKKHPRLYLYGSYTRDLDFGQNYYGEVTSDNIFALAIRKPNIPIKYMKVDEKRFEFYNEQRSGLSTLFAVTHKQYIPLKNIPPKDSFVLNNGRDAMASFETSLKIRFAYLEKFLENDFFRTSLGSPYPIGELYLSKGFAGVAKSGYDYFKISGSVSDYIKVPPYGSFSFNVYAGKTFGTLPYVFLDIAPGNELYYYNTYAFNTMNKYEFIHDKYAGVNLDYNIGNGLFRFIPVTRKLKFRQFFTIKTLWGSLSDANKTLNFKQGNTFQTLDGKTFMELGTGVDNILRVFRLDFVWRMMPRPLPKVSSERFGVFGSFRLSF
ncbi:MAG: carboxypeptidase-like regulatory domain-containing protein [Bacteroidetes bacterium]|nr:carboxypeptidase-like regulatory domain-containing protein [Bacteroidota bacterium]MBS1930795.1 carboxypeptidase-like regulatory domain-containing protein [Bacteroidota bacterium]